MISKTISGLNRLLLTGNREETNVNFNPDFLHRARVALLPSDTVAFAGTLWLKNLPLLVSTNNVDEREPRIHYMAPGPERQRERSRTLQGIAKAMAEQWFIS